MNSATFSGFARTGLVVIVVVLAIVAGLAVGNAINGRGGTLNGYPPGWQGGAAVPVSRVANTSFSLDALKQLQAIRGDAAAPAFIDYGLRHGLVARSKAPAEVDYVDEARQRSAANDHVKKAAPAPMAPGI